MTDSMYERLGTLKMTDHFATKHYRPPKTQFKLKLTLFNPALLNLLTSSHLTSSTMALPNI